jgi:AcrR family transcriptional regulator
MTTRDDQREKVVAALSRHLLATGLSQVSLRQLASAAGVSDRMLLYYFADKADVLASVIGRIVGEMSAELAASLPEGERFPPAALIARAAAFTTGDALQPYMRLWIEMVAAAARREEPFVTIAAQVMAGFQAWVDARLDVPAGADRVGIAAAIIACIDGLALVAICSGEEMAARGAECFWDALGG